VFVPIIPRNTVLPATRTKEFYTVVHLQKSVDVEVFQGEDPVASQNLLVKSFNFPLEPMPEKSPVGISFSYTLDGTVDVRVAQRGTANTMAVSVSVADAATPSAAVANEVTVRPLDAPAAPTPPPAPAPTPARPPNAIEKKALALRARLQGADAATLDALLYAYRHATGDAHEPAEEALLDFLIEHD